MIQKILDAVSNLTGSYTEIIESEKIIKMLLSFMIIDKVFKITPQEDGVILQQDASVFLNYLNEQLDLYIEDKDIKLFLFSSLTIMYFIDSKRILDSTQFKLLISNDNEELYQKIRERLRPELVECFRQTELFFQDKPVEEVAK